MKNSNQRNFNRKSAIWIDFLTVVYLPMKYRTNCVLILASNKVSFVSDQEGTFPSWSTIQYHLDHGLPKVSMNLYPEWIHRFLCCTMIQVILDHSSELSQRNDPSVCFKTVERWLIAFINYLWSWVTLSTKKGNVNSENLYKIIEQTIQM